MLSHRPIQIKKQVRFRDACLVEINDSKSISFQSLFDSREKAFGTPYKDAPTDPYRDDSPVSDSKEDTAKLSTPRPDISRNQHLKQHQLMLQQQKEHLDRLAANISRQHQLFLRVGDELDSHLELLNDLDRLTDKSQNRSVTAR